MQKFYATVFSRIQHFRETAVMPFLQMLTQRKFTCFLLLYVLSCCLLAYGGTVLRTVALLSAGLLLALVLLLAYRKRFWCAVFVPLLAGILCGSMQSFLVLDLYTGRTAVLAEQETEITVQAEVVETMYTNAYSGTYICRVTGNGMPFRVVMQSASPSLKTGQILQGDIRLLPWDQTDDGFDEQRYYMSKGVSAAAEDMGLQDTGKVRFRLTEIFQKWNRYLSDRISAHVRNDGLPLAMLLGNRSSLSDEVQRDFRRLGILHLIAVSGTHFSLLASMTERFMIRLKIRPVRRMWVLGVLTVLYMLLTGMTASVRRAGLMFLLALLCRGLEYKVRYFTALNLACGVILLFDPFAALDAGLHLSYLAVCGCLLTIHVESDWEAYRKFLKPPVHTDGDGKRIPPVRGWHRRLSPRYLAKKGISMMFLNLVITCLTLPLSWLYFGEMSLASLFTNLLYIPATGALLFLTLVYLLLYPFGIFVPVLGNLLSVCTALLEYPASVISAIPHISVSLLYPFVPFFLLPMVLSVCVLPFLRHKLRGIALSLSLLLLLGGSVFVYEAVTADQTALVYRNDRLKDGFVVRSAGDVLLVDVSDGSSNFTNQLLTEAEKLYATELEGYLLTHYHNRHVGTFQKLTDNWILRTLYLPEPVTEEETAVFSSLLHLADKRGIETVIFSDTVEFGHLTLETAERIYLTRSSHPVTGLRFICGGETIAYGSSSFSEGDPVISRWMADGDIGILGAHSPVYKKTFALPFAEKPKVFLWNGDSDCFYSGSLPAAETDLLDCTRFAFRFPDATGKNGAGNTGQ